MDITRFEPATLYSAAVRSNGFLFLSGITPKNRQADIQGQTREVLAEIDRLLGLGGLERSRVVSAMIWVSDIRLRDAMNEEWVGWVGDHRPARACVEAKLADPAMLVEIQVTAAA
ncbi:RidA family protein [Phreatobacter oligotrophus]|jgi:enamine deaminase RidA (YjgF/YER057c/UK114 family)|uniref:Enamine deaminase RidA (YjgF/YER057c/UK114 family) n=1 Tax=Phreatobacter oligotrophus TaxID=1122261 RepID=A0A2T4YYR9_9HYPH|nr:RidA family protein [Phreatobacter oligotrophus]PTM51883.1 enamine deaminase RidA (YjgF/YER057c/UK114 family) [Phreatobacter oligotrophus]